MVVSDISIRLSFLFALAIFFYFHLTLVFWYFRKFSIFVHTHSIFAANNIRNVELDRHNFTMLVNAFKSNSERITEIICIHNSTNPAPNTQNENLNLFIFICSNFRLLYLASHEHEKPFTSEKPCQKAKYKNRNREFPKHQNQIQHLFKTIASNWKCNGLIIGYDFIHMNVYECNFNNT